MILGAVLLGAHPPAGAAEFSSAAALTAGFDSNPLRLPDGVRRGGMYEETFVRGGLRQDMGKKTFFFMDGSGNFRNHASDVSDADRSAFNIRSGFQFTPFSSKHRSLRVALGTRYGIRRETFVDTATGDPFVLFEDSGQGVVTRPIDDRLDTDIRSAFVRIRWRFHRRLALSLDADGASYNYVEDYPDISVLDPLDFKRGSFSPSLGILLTDSVRMDLSFSRNLLDYRARQARDESGDPVPGTTTRYAYTEYGVSFRFALGRSSDLRFGAETTDRSDQHVGYYDYSSMSGFVAFETEAGRHQWSFNGSMRTVAYDRATISGDPSDQVRDSDILAGVGRYAFQLAPRLSLFAEVGLQDSGSTDPDFTYGRQWSAVGVRFSTPAN